MANFTNSESSYESIGKCIPSSFHLHMMPICCLVHAVCCNLNRYQMDDRRLNKNLNANHWQVILVILWKYFIR